MGQALCHVLSCNQNCSMMVIFCIMRGQKNLEIVHGLPTATNIMLVRIQIGIEVNLTPKPTSFLSYLVISVTSEWL